MREKLHSQAGETISEVLIALLISALALTMLATMISSTLSQVTKSKENMKNYYQKSEALEQHTGGTSGQVIIQAEGKVSEKQNVTLYINDFFGGADKGIYAYEK